MNHIRTILMPEPEIEFTAGEGTLLFVAALHHYDGKCQQAAKQGGVLFGLLNQLELDPETVRLFSLDQCQAAMNNPKTATVRLNMDDMSIICKIAESPLLIMHRDLRVELTELYRSLNHDISLQLDDQPA